MSKPNISIPAEFAANGTKTDFSALKILNGFDRINPDVLAGDNLNKFIDDTYKGLNGTLELFDGCVLYDPVNEYNDHSIVFNINTNNDVEVYRSLINNNLGNPLTDTTKWQKIPIELIDKHALKSYLDEGELLNDEEGLADVKSYAHSTFDLSKFTVVGSPTITDDGVASGFSASNYLKTPTIDYSGTNTVTIKCAFKYYSVSSYTNVFGGGSINHSPRIILNPNGSVSLYLYDGTTQNTNVIAATCFSADNWYYIEWAIGSTVASYKLYDYHTMSLIRSDSYTSANPLTLNFNTWLNPIYVGRSPNSSDTGFNSEIDLKQFSITVDGVEVFSGNKTGIDTIKPDDYTKVGTPTISDDGIASGFSSSNYLLVNNTGIDNTAPSWKITSAFTTNLTGNYQEIWCEKVSNQAQCYIRIDTSNKLRVHLIADDSTTIINFVLGSTVLSNNTNYLVETIYNGTTYQVLLTNLSTGVTTTEATATSAKKIRDMSTLLIGVRGVATPDNMFAGSIDLNAFKIYVDGNLICQPCLKIPYTLSKTGSKVVDSVYRDRVQSMYAEFGYAPYYTLSDTDFTLPMGEIYGMIDKKTDKSIFDGQWISSVYNVAESAAVRKTDQTFSLSDYLPDDGYNYEVIVYASCATGDASGNYAHVSIKTDIISAGENASPQKICQAYTRANNATASEGSTITVIGVGRTLTVYGYDSPNHTGTYNLGLLGYRRIGTNS